MVRVLKTQTVQSIGYILFLHIFQNAKKAGNPQFSRVSGLKLTAGIEPATYALRVRRSTD